ncbi:hypothetical protein Shyhy01_33330 [Streptomyces hygroscopicus subsp. hygroscopicus]|nr:hypothetical protein [Streptomyces hygroscopicus]GLX50383.1 hypothetical protein Shyhy01_33330 [Streptomyces hygroscopicus subsp. hygroscopicus]
MRQTFSATGPGAHRGLGAVLLLVLPVLPHAALAPWPWRLPAPDLDDRPQRRGAAALVCDCRAAPAAVLAAAGGDDREQGEAPPSSGASAHGPGRSVRQAGSQEARVRAPAWAGVASPEATAAPARPSAPGGAAVPVVLRC